MSTTELLTDPAPVAWTAADYDRMVGLGILPANHTRHGVRFTRDQYFDLAEHGFFDGRRVMLIYGEVLEMAAVKYPHASSVSGVAEAFRTAFGSGYYVQEEKPLDVGTDTEPEPDVTVVPGSRKSYTQTPTASVALVVVEVSDTTLFYDTTTKAELYATAGIRDYWVVDVVNELLHVFRDPTPFAGAIAYRTRFTLTVTDTITLLAVPNTPIPVADLLP
jgi:Uma2 family endonuclease